MKIKEILQYMESRFPYDLAADFDLNKIGLTIGNENNEVKNILFSLDLTNEAIEEAIKNECNLIIAHHPFVFTPLTKILENDEKGSLIYNMVKNNISLIAMHTNMDLGFNGVADTLCEMLELKQSNIGIHQKNEYIRCGIIDEITVGDFAIKLKNTFNLNGVKIAGDLNRKITKVGILGGSGAHESDIDRAIEEGCQCYVTGEIKHNIALKALYHNLTLIEISHGVEKFVFEKLSNDINEKFNVKTFISKHSSNLFQYK